MDGMDKMDRMDRMLRCSRCGNGSERCRTGGWAGVVGWQAGRAGRTLLIGYRVRWPIRCG